MGRVDEENVSISQSIVEKLRTDVLNLDPVENDPGVLFQELARKRLDAVDGSRPILLDRFQGNQRGEPAADLDDVRRARLSR